MNRLVSIAGSGGGGGGGGGHIAANSLFSNATLKCLDLISEGQIGGLVDGAKSIYFDDVPLQNANGSYNFDGIGVDWVNGTPDQKVLKGFNDISNPQGVGAEVKNGLPITATINNNEADKIRVIVSLPSLYSQDSKGNINETSVQIRFELAIENSGKWQHLGDYTIKGKQNSQYERSYEFKLPKTNQFGDKVNYWLLRMTRLSADSSERYSARTILDTVHVITESQLNYPYSALVGLTANAEQLNSIPTRSYLVDGLYIQIPSNYDPKTNKYSGVWNGTFKLAVSSNPAWILYALLTNKRWGLGNFISPEQVNKAKLYEIGRYCDEEVDNGYGRKEKRFTINTQIQERSDAYRLISDISAVFRGMAYWAGGMANFTCDKPTEASMLYTPANVINGEFTYSGSSRNDRHSVALVTWNDPEQNYKQVVEYIEDADLIAKYGIRQAELTAFGCTSRAQAIRAGRWILYTESYESDMITFNVGIDSALVLPGDVIKIQDPSYAGKRLGGRAIKCGLNRIELDSKVELSTGNDTTISIRMPDGSFVERNVKVGYTGEYDALEWNDPLPSTPEPNAIWIVSEATLKPIIARVVNIEQGEQPNTFRITAVSHQPKKYDLIEKGIEFEKDPTTSDPLDIEAPKNPNVEEVANSLGLGYVSSVLNLSWLGGRGCISYELEWRRENENETEWETISTRAKGLQLYNVQRGTYHFKLRGVGLMGNKSPDVEFYYLAKGQYVTPLDVTDFRVIKRPSYLEVKWSPVKDATSYELRCGTTWDEGQILTQNFAGTSFVHYQYEAGIYYYHIRSISPSGEYSPNVTTYKLELNAPAMPVDLTAVVSQNRIDFTWKSNTEDDLSHYEMREGQSWDSGVKVAESKVNQMSVPAGAESNRRFWLKAIALPKIYSQEASFVEIGIVADTSRNIVLTHNARTLGWNSNRVYMKEAGDDLMMETDEIRGEYIAKMTLPNKITAQTSFFSSISTVVEGSEDTETWATAKFPWNSNDAKRAWRLGGDGDSIGYENQIARYVGALHELDSWSLDGSLESERGIKASASTGVSYDWGRYYKGLNVSDITGVSWKGNIVDPINNGVYKLSFWVKTKEAESNSMLTYLKYGNSENELKITYNTEDKCFRLVDSKGQVITVELPIQPNRHVFFAVSQTENERTFGVGILGGEVKIKTALYTPLGNVDHLNVGSHAI